MAYHDDVLRARAQRDTFLAEHYASPLPEEDMDGFTGLDYFPVDPAWRLEGEFTPSAPTKAPIPSSSGTESPYTVIGKAVVTIAVTPVALVVLDDGDGNAFIAFGDRTNGHETYGGGRYVDVEVRDDGTSVVDFNGARNPYCAYDPEFVCPLPPAENRLDVAIPAGERAYRPRR